MKLSRRLIAFSSVVLGGLTTAPSAFAANTVPSPAVIRMSINSAGFKITDIGTLFTGLLNMVMFVAAILVFAYLVWGGVQWITSGGDKGKTEEARNKITAAIIGLAVVAASYAIFILVISFLGVGNPFAGTFQITPAYNTNGVPPCVPTSGGGCPTQY